MSTPRLGLMVADASGKARLIEGRPATKRRPDYRRPAPVAGLRSGGACTTRRVVIVVSLHVLYSVGSNAAQDGAGERAVKQRFEVCLGRLRSRFARRAAQSVAADVLDN